VTNRLNPNDRLPIGQSLTSPNGQFSLLMQTDSNLVAYHGTVATTNAYFASNTEWNQASQKPQYLTLQGNANLVLFDSSNTVRWQSGTWGPDFVNPYFVIQDDGNLVVYHDGLKPIWAWGRWPDRQGAIPGRGEVTLATSENPIFPINAEQVDSFPGVGGHMKTDVSIYDNGTFSATTELSEDTLLRGFVGGAVALLLDANQKILWSSQTEQGGVDGHWIGTSQRILSWSAQVPTVLLPQARFVAIKQMEDERDVAAVIKQWLDGISNDASDLASIVKTIATIAATA
jgi:hypothetical protein